MPEHAGDLTWVELEVKQPKWAGYSFKLSYRAGELAGLEILRSDEADRLAAHLLQRVPLGTLDRAARRHVDGFLTEWSKARNFYTDAEDWLDAVADPDENHDDDFDLARLCQRYLELNGDSGWRETLAAEFHYSTSAVQTIIGRARKRRFLTQVPRGQYGGQLTPKSLRILGLLDRPKAPTAWERATPEERASALERDRRVEELDRQLLAGEVTATEYQERTIALYEED